MLSLLRIRDFAILQRAELPFGPGLTALTGETGAGKSILLDALAAVLGGRATDKAVRHGCDSAEVEALFDAPLPLQTVQALRDAGVDDLEQLVLRRVIAKAGAKNRCYANGRLVTAQTLRQIAAPLVDLSAQHAQHRLLDPAAHVDVLDRFAGNQSARRDYDAAFLAWRQAAADLAQLQAQQQRLAERLDYLRFVAKELNDLQPKAGEIAQLQADVARLRSAESLGKAVQEAGWALSGDGSVRELCAKHARALEKLAVVDGQLLPFAQRMREIEILAGDLDFDLGTFGRSVRRDDRELGRKSERLDALLRAARKFGGSEDAMVQRWHAVQAELDADATELRVHELERAQAQHLQRAEQIAEELSERRALAAPALAKTIGELLDQLGMAGATLRFEISRRRELQGDGIDELRLLLRANRGESEGPLHEFGSGGELSRVLLAIQRALGQAAWSQAQAGDTADPLPTAVFDEADAGLSGATGIVLGKFLLDAAAGQQVIVISHLPQVAAAADAHVQVSKAELAGRTLSHARVLDADARVDELARMLGVVEGQGDTALAHARELLAGQRKK